ncbi:hypothetical protein RVR_5777 [Actinacidiphila reveromycinica]|uniref:Uncharacterized protein n=1 Tax=Actinacidiphila reveromycinica TaxID=659352 RepID=A0A7U3VQ17_9ACTN|nr:hypothetical protein [Streptomyces sp. SN-593]BBA99238.1 hypothetical protein RVR_5777 [Streptomyces sp. SN-593]
MTKALTALAAPTTRTDRRPLFAPDGRVHLDALSEQMADADKRGRSFPLAEIARLAKADALNVRERLTWPRVVIEECPLDEGTVIVYREVKSTGRYHLGWDPAQTTRDQVEVFINIYIAGSGEYHAISPATYRDLRRIESHRRADDDPNMTAMWDAIVDLILTHNDAPGVMNQVGDIMRAEQARKAATAQVVA